MILHRVSFEPSKTKPIQEKLFTLDVIYVVIYVGLVVKYFTIDVFLFQTNFIFI